MNCNCEEKKDDCECKETANGFDSWLEVLEEEEQPACNIDNQEDCENCGS